VEKIVEGNSAMSAAAMIDRTITEAITAGVFPGAVVLVTREGAVCKRTAYGHSLLYHDLCRRQEQPIPMTPETIFDLASLTKVVVTTTAVLQLAERGRIALDAPVCTYLDGFARPDKRAITVRQLLTHTSGLPADRPSYRRFHGAEAIVAAVGRARLAGAPGARVIYSDLGFIALGAIGAIVARVSLDRYAATHIFAPLGLRHTGYLPPPAAHARIAPTEYRRGRALVWGGVHDEKAAAMGGVSGHAGLFGTADDLAVFTTMLLNEGRHGSRQIVRPETVRAMFTAQTGALSPSRGLGWLRDDPSFMGTLASEHTTGHTGFTGTSIVLDLARRLSVILLTNRVHPSRNGPAIGPTRAAVAGAAATLSTPSTPSTP